MGIKYHLSKHKLLTIFIAIALAIICLFAIFNILRIIKDSRTPLSSVNTEAMFYVENSESGSITCIGDGLINTRDEISSNISSVKQKIVSAPDYSAIIGKDLTIVWHSISYSDGEFRVYGVLKPNDGTNTSYVFASVDEMKNSNIALGATVSTLGFYATNDGGAATYSITKTPKFSANDYTTFKLNNGAYAELQYDTSINVACLGIFPDNDCSKKLNAVLTLFDNNLDSLVFNNGNYYFANQVFLKSLKMIGANNTTFQVSTNFNPNAKRIFLTNINRHDIKYSLGFENISFVVTTASNHSLKNTEFALMCLSDIEQCTIKNCKFIAQNTPQDRTFMKCDLLWFQQSSNSNITIDNCSFINNAAEGIKSTASSPLVGACLWISGANTESKLEHVNISNCNFSTTCSDEALAIWKCNANDINFTKCNFTIAENFSNNLTAIYNGTFNNVNFNKCTFTANGSTACMVKLRNFLADSSFRYSNCNFQNISTNKTIDMRAVFYTNENFEGDTANKSIILDNCTFTSGKDSIQSFKYAINNYGGALYDYKISNCDVYMNLTNAVISSSETTDCEVTATKSNIDTDSKLTNVTNASDVDLSFDNNTIYSDFTNQFNQETTGSLSFTNNTCKSTGTVALDNCQKSTLDHDNIVIDNNTFESKYTLIKKIR